MQHNFLPNRFYIWWIDTYGDRDRCPRWNRLNFHAEYGMGTAEFLAHYPEDAIADAKDYFDKNPKEYKKLIPIWKINLENERDRIKNHLKGLELTEYLLTQWEETK